jgi:hypothetical protein
MNDIPTFESLCEREPAAAAAILRALIRREPQRSATVTKAEIDTVEDADGITCAHLSDDETIVLTVIEGI